MKNLITFFENTGVNWSVIWSDCSPYLCAWLFILLILSLILIKNYNTDLKNKQTVKLNEKICSLEFANKELSAKNNDLTIRLQKTERKRDEKGHYLPILGNGHGKKKL